MRAKIARTGCGNKSLSIKFGLELTRVLPLSRIPLRRMVIRFGFWVKIRARVRVRAKVRVRDGVRAWFRVRVRVRVRVRFR